MESIFQLCLPIFHTDKGHKTWPEMKFIDIVRKIPLGKNFGKPWNLLHKLMFLKTAGLLRNGVAFEKAF